MSLPSRSTLAAAVERLPIRLAWAFALIALVLGRELADRVYASGDIASAPVMGALWTDGDVLLGFYNWFEGLLYERATRWVPGHTFLWTWGPWVLTLAAVAAVAWTATAVTGRRWTGWTFFAVVFCAPVAVLPLQFGWSAHGLAWVHTLLVGAFVVTLVHRGGWLTERRAVHVAATLALGLYTGLGFASDKLVAVAAIIPCAITALLLLRLAPRAAAIPAAASALAVAVLGAASGPLIRSAVEDAGVVGVPYRVTGAGGAQRADNVDLLWRSGASLFGGDWAAVTGARHVLAIVCALIAAALLAAALAGAARLGVRALAKPADEQHPARATFLVFWGLSIGALIGAFILSTAPQDVTSARYIVVGGWAVMAIAAVLAAGRAWSRQLVGLALGIVAFAGVVSLVHDDVIDPLFPTRPDADALRAVAQGYDVHKSYAGYWDAAGLTWLTRAKTPVYPTIQCGGSNICPMDQQRAEQWYEPVPNIRTMVVTRPVLGPFAGTSRTDPRFGKPAHSQTVGPYVVYIYDYDVAARFGRLSDFG